MTYPVDSVIHLLNNRGQHYIIIIYISNFHHFENVIKMRETPGYDELISNRCFIRGHREQSVMGCVSSEQTDEELNSLASFVKFNYEFAQN